MAGGARRPRGAIPRASDVAFGSLGERPGGVPVRYPVPDGKPNALPRSSPSEEPAPSDVPPSTEPPSSSDPSPTDLPSPTGTPAPTLVPLPSPSPVPAPPGSSAPHPRHQHPIPPRVRRLLVSADGRMHRGHHRSWKGWEPDPRWGTYGTATLDLAAAKLRARGWSEEKIARTIYTPFIVEGPATWSDTWGAPRWAGGYHPHHGQDVLCRYGAPVLAVDKGFLRYGDGPLGGLTVSLIRDDGSFWYYAHLKAYVPGLVDGSEVGIGTVIGFCGASGDASVPHVHFSYYTADGEAVDPMKALVGWLGWPMHGSRVTLVTPGRPRVPPSSARAGPWSRSTRSWIARPRPLRRPPPRAGRWTRSRSALRSSSSVRRSSGGSSEPSGSSRLRRRGLVRPPGGHRRSSTSPG